MMPEAKPAKTSDKPKRFDGTGKKVDIKAVFDGAGDSKPEKKAPKVPGNVAKYLDAVKARHKSLPTSVLEAISGAASKGRAKVILKNHLQATRPLV